MSRCDRSPPSFVRLGIGLCLVAATVPSVHGQQERIEEETLPREETTTEAGEPAIEEGSLEIPDDADELEALAERTYLAGELAVASDLYRRLASRLEGERKVEALVTAAWLDFQSGEADEASRLLTAALSIDPEHEFTAANYSQGFADLYRRSLRAAKSLRTREGTDQVRRGLELIAADDLDAARTTFQRALDLDEDDPFARYNLALVDMKTGDVSAAISGFERVLAQQSRRPDSMTSELHAQTCANLGLLYFEKGFPEDAQRHLEQAVELNPDDASAWNNLGLARRRLDDEEGAADAFRRALAADPDDRAALVNAATLAMHRRQWEVAVDLLDDATAAHSGDARVWLNLALARRGQGDLDGSLAALDRVLTLDPDNDSGTASRAAATLAVVQYERGAHEEAVAAAERAIEWRPDALQSWIYLGLAQQQLGRLAPARRSFERAVEIDPTSAEAHNNLGTTLVALGELEPAAEAFREALSRRPDFGAARSNLETVERRLAESADGSDDTEEPVSVEISTDSPD